MPRCRAFRYPSRTRIRALEIFYRADCDCTAVEIAGMLEAEGHGEVARNAVERWLRESPSRRAIQAAALSQRLRQQAAAATGDEQDASERIRISTERIADVLAVTAERAQRELPRMELKCVEDFARLATCMRDLASAMCESNAALQQLQMFAARREGNGTKNTERAPAAIS